MGQCRRWPGEIDQYVKTIRQRREIGRDGHVQSTDSGHFAGIGAHERAGRVLGGRRAANTFRSVAGIE